MNKQMTPNTIEEDFRTYMLDDSKEPLFINDNALQVLKSLPDKSISMCITSPPYWGQRQYENGGIGLEKKPNEYIDSLCEIFLELKRVLKDDGSFWLNIGDTYKNKALQGLPWRIAFELIDNQGWILRNSVIWNKVKGGPDNSKDKLRNIHENIFHFVKKAKGYYYDANAVRKKPREAKIEGGSVISATGVSGVRYKRQIELSTDLTSEEKKNALCALNETLETIKRGELSDFRMLIRGQQRATHSDSEKVSGRAKELKEKGFCILKYHPKGSKPSDVWDILPEDTHKRKKHFAAYPTDICKIPILATCPEDGVVLDMFCGTGTTMLVSKSFKRKSIGIDLSTEYISLAKERCGEWHH